MIGTLDIELAGVVDMAPGGRKVWTSGVCMIIVEIWGGKMFMRKDRSHSKPDGDGRKGGQKIKFPLLYSCRSESLFQWVLALCFSH